MNTAASTIDKVTTDSTVEIVEALSTRNRSALSKLLKLTAKPNLDHLPGDKGMPIVGHIYPFTTDLHGWFDSQYAKHGPVFKFKAFNREVVILLGPDATRLVLQNEDTTFSNYLAYGPTIRNLLDNNVLGLDFSDHKTTRKTLQAAFKRKAVEGHMELMNPMLKNSIANWPTGKNIKAMDHIKQIMLNTNANVFLGAEPGPDMIKLNQAFIDLVRGGASFIRKEIPFSPFAKARKGRKTMNEFVNKNIPQRRKVETRDMLSQLCHAKDDDGKLLSDEEVCNQIIFVLFAAHDTTTSALSSIFYALATNPEWQEELREEMFSLNKDDLEFEDIDKLVKTGLTFQEALRMYAPVPMFPRYALKEFEFAGHTIPANTTVMNSAIFSHYMPEYWTDPHKFNPMRFSPERAEDKKDFFQYAPFGGGAHKCLGLHFATVQGRMFLFHFLKQYRISKNSKMTKFKYNHFPLTFPTDGLPLTFTKI